MSQRGLEVTNSCTRRPHLRQDFDSSAQACESDVGNKTHARLDPEDIIRIRIRSDDEEIKARLMNDVRDV